ncbi:MAG: PilW family protein [Acidimicrobiales bacterium]
MRNRHARLQHSLLHDRGDSAFSLVELLVTMSILLIVTAIVAMIYGPLSSQATNTTNLAQNEGRVRNVVRVLEADLRSADPLLLVPSSFTADPDGTSASGTYSTSPTDIVAMYEPTDRYSPCPAPPPSTSSAVPTPFEESPFAANVIWAYDPGPGANAGTLIRYSYCPSSSSLWTPGLVLRDVVNAPATMFALTQTSLPLSLQSPTPTSTTIPNQAAPACGRVERIYIQVRSRAERTPYTIRATIDLPNQVAVQPGACE